MIVNYETLADCALDHSCLTKKKSDVNMFLKIIKSHILDVSINYWQYHKYQ